MTKQFGAKASKANIESYSKSKHWNGKIFLNLEETKMEFGFYDLPKLLYKQFFERTGREPKQNLPLQAFDSSRFLEEASHAKFIWYGHSVVLMRIANLTVLIDPMLGQNAAPIAPFAVKRFSKDTLNIIPELPEIDVLIMSHDHYDHLDYDSIQNLKSKVKKYYVALGVARHLIEWGIPKEDITEFDWWQDEQIGDLQITFTPSRHFSGRGLLDRAKGLWGGWVFKTETENIWFSGDGGYGQHFKEIGERLGPFDFAFMECGQYNTYWHQIHMYPEESVQAGIEGKSSCLMPVHWGGFSLALHGWKEPAERFVADCKQAGLNYRTPKLGELMEMGDLKETEEWWESIE
jgi:L-ascorbate metabolism protein UlaG (beta-lactamase superfamily)